MKAYIIVIVIGFLAVSCNKNDEDSIKIDPLNEISFDVELINSDENFVSKAKNLTVRYKQSSWWRHLDDTNKISLNRSKSFDLELDNGKVLEFSLGFRKNEANEDLLLLENENLSLWERNWDYKSFESEATDFYQAWDYFHFSIDTYGYTIERGTGNFSFVSSEKALVNGEEKSYVTIRFDGDAFGPYDSTGKYGAYKITNGTFKGVIE